jgi:hypothetical protein
MERKLTFREFKRWATILASNHSSSDPGNAPIGLWRICCLVLLREHMTPATAALLSAHLVGEFMVDVKCVTVSLEYFQHFLYNVHFERMNEVFLPHLQALGFDDVEDMMTRHVKAVPYFLNHPETGFYHDSLLKSEKFMPSWKDMVVRTNNVILFERK